uniref:ADP-ribosylhydrolase ARH3 n=1 Tax=Syphacia muris TaxID=451379 RepID=A0A0N5AEJ1_9BILA
MIKKALGCLYGQLIGDAFGCRYEFFNAAKTANMMKKDSDPNGFIPILGGGPFGLSPGQVTDDSEMALSLAASLCRCKSFDAVDVTTAYVQWAQSGPPDIGIATAAALTVGVLFQKTIRTEKKAAENKVIDNVERHNGGSLSNGCLMRISPLAVAVSKSSSSMLDAAVEGDCRLTHCNKICFDAVRVYCHAIGSLLNGSSAKKAYSDALSYCRTSVVKDVLVAAEGQPKPVKTSCGMVEGDTKCMGYIGVALQSAFFELLHADSFANGILSAVERGGDTDTNGAIVGALLGNLFNIAEVDFSAW